MRPLLRDSKLTRILQESLGGRCKTVIVATLSPSITAIEESVSTLNYAQSANGIVNKPVSSSLISVGQNITNNFADKMSEECNSIESWQEMEMRLQYMQTQVEEAQAALARKHLHQQELQERADKAEAELLENQQKLYDAGLEIKSLKEFVEAETKKRKQTEKELHETQIDLKKTAFILKATQATEFALTSEAQSLIGTLEDVVNERNEMHELIVSQRDMESERRKATKQFQEAALAVLSNIESSFLNLCYTIETNQRNAVEIATFCHGVGRQSVIEAQELLSDIAKNVSSVTDSIKAQLTGESGIVPFTEAITDSVMAELKSAKTVLDNGEEAVEESGEAARRRLDECTKILGERASSIQTATSQTLQSFESKVNESANAISRLVEKVKRSLLDLSISKAEATKSIESLVGQWRDQSIDNSKKVINFTLSCCNSFQKSIEEFQNEMFHHESIMKSLDSQRSFISTHGSAHVQTVRQQSANLNAHREKLASCHNTQNKLRNEVMQSIMSGVEALVTSEIAKLASAQTDHFKLLDNDGADLLETNEKVIQSAKHVLESIQSTNQFVSEKATFVCNNDLKAEEAMKSTHKILTEVINSSTTHQQLTIDFASKSNSFLSEMKQMDRKNAEIASMIEKDGNSCSASLVTSVLNPTNSAVKSATQLSLDTFTYVNDVVFRDVNESLDDIANKRKFTASQLNTKFESSDSQILNLKKNVLAIATSQHDAVGRLCDETMTTSVAHQRQTVPYYVAELDSGKDKLISTMAQMVELSTGTISAGKAQGEIAKQSIEDFAHNKMQCTKPVAPAPLRKNFIFSSKLSSTPADDEILNRCYYDSSESENVTPLSLVACKVEPPDADTSQESQEDDNSSRKSSGSLSSIPSPGLKQRDMNANHGELPSCPKYRKHPRHVVSSISKKNKAPLCNTPLASRKRTKR